MPLSRMTSMTEHPPASSRATSDPSCRVTSRRGIRRSPPLTMPRSGRTEVVGVRRLGASDLLSQHRDSLLLAVAWRRKSSNEHERERRSYRTVRYDNWTLGDPGHLVNGYEGGREEHGS